MLSWLNNWKKSEKKNPIIKDEDEWKAKIRQ